ncbi:Rne/Rng family ribonuclease [Aquibacillus halophilus]|uniref:Rne/Rng family ribonuclease n=1 Tax=Aquibacillus halophilus TaxID=930132 RepID=A0A6A8DP05_9BACI|nr:Rne/Rng family ribonuclease [Aquibacillus halophilus]MRH42982.1 Rne/Rng family ribonuclease [Aquibacillus halophilus]
MVSIYIQSATTEQIGIVKEKNRVTELIVNRPTQTNQVGNIYIGRVITIEKGLQAAFIDIGDDKHGFLQRKELPEARKDNKKGIESVITEGQSILVQVQKEAYGNKGARLTTNLTVPGINIVYLPHGNYIAVSKKLSDKLRVDLRKEIDSIRQGEEGAIIRTSAKDCSIDITLNEYTQLRDKWRLLEIQSRKCTVPSCVYTDKTVPDRLIRQFSPSEIKEIYLDSSDEARRIRSEYPSLQESIHWEKNIEDSLPFSVKQLMEQAVNPLVQTNTGVELIIEQTEAMTVIDVNTAGFTGKTSKSQTIVQANIDAAIEVAKQIRFRNLSGIIIIDFIDMNNNSSEEKVVQAFKKELAKDSVRTEIYGFTKLGLLEMTRKRESQTLPYLLLDNNQMKRRDFSSITYAYMLERELFQYQTSQYEALYIEISPAVYKSFQNEINLAKLKESILKEVFIKITRSVASYVIKLTGSQELVTSHFSRNNNDSIDKLF